MTDGRSARVRPGRLSGEDYRVKAARERPTPNCFVVGGELGGADSSVKAAMIRRTPY
jgi:hypothetical protein